MANKNRFPVSLMWDFKEDLDEYVEHLHKIFNHAWQSRMRGLARAEIQRADKLGINVSSYKKIRLSAPMDDLNMALEELEKRFGEAFVALSMREKIKKSVRLVKRKAIADFKAEVAAKAQGFSPFVDNRLMQNEVKRAIAERVSLVKTIPRQYHGDLRRTVYSGIREGWATDTFRDNLEKRYSVASNRTLTLSQDQTGTLYSEVTKSQHKSLNLKRFQWFTVLDDRTRERHIPLDGQIFSWSEGAAGEFPGQAINCYDSKTEVLTDQGFKFFEDLNGSEKILSMNSETREMEYLKPDKYIKYHFSGNMVHIKNNTFDLMVTPNHRMPCISKWIYEEKYKENRTEPLPLKIKRADDMKLGDRLPRNALWTGKQQDVITIRSEIKGNMFDVECDFPTKEFIKFMAWYLSEGSTTKVGVRRGHSYQIKITQHDLENHSEIKDICKSLFNTVWVGKNAIYIIDDGLASYLYNFGKSWKKYIPKQIKQLSPEYLKLFLQIYIKGDGHRQSFKEYQRRQSDQIQCFTSSYRMASDLAELILKIGKVPSIIAPKESEYREVEFNNGVYKIKHPIYKVFINQHKYASFQHKYQSLVEYDGYVYDVELPRNHILYVKRNNKTIWSGNCRCTASALRSELKKIAGI